MSDFIPGQSFYTSPPTPVSPPSETAPQSPTPGSQQDETPASHAPSGPRWAAVVSSVFSPLLIPTYAAIISLWATPLNIVRESARLTSAVIILLITCFLPLGVLMAAVRFGKISDTKVRDRKQRYMLYPVAVIAYGLAAIYLYNVHAPGWFIGFYLGACLASIASMTINFRWKISAHATCCGGFMALCFFIGFAGLNNFFFLPWISGAVLVAGIVATARIALGAHTPAQLAAGTAVGLAAVILMMTIFY